MKKLVAVLALALVWGCQDRTYAPFQFTAPQSEDTQYGKSVVKLPALALLAKPTGVKVDYKFSLTITGDNMQTMTFGWPVSESGASFTIDKIPAGTSRLFEGVLYGSNGEQYEGTAYADIYAGKTAYVTLVLRKSGSAQVEVIIEDLNQNEGVIGCYEMKGSANKVDLTGIVMNIMQVNNDQLFVYFYRDGQMIGKFYGTVQDMKMSGDFVMPEIVSGYMNLYLASGFTAFKGEIYDKQGGTFIGSCYGSKVSCDIVNPPSKCENDTLGGPGSTSCKDSVTWVKYATDACMQRGLMLTNYSLQSPCTKKPPYNYETICFECCAGK